MKHSYEKEVKMGFLDYFKLKRKTSNAIGLRIFIVLFLSILSILIYSLVVFFLRYDEIGELNRECESGNRKSCAKLIDIAQNDSDDWRRERAVRILTDQTVLSDIAKNPREESWVRFSAIRNPYLSDQNLLIEIATKEKNEWVRKYAADKLADKSLAQNVYVYIVQNCEGENLRGEATRKLTDKALLTDIAKNDKQSMVRIEAADKLDDKVFAQTIYAEVAKNAKESRNRCAAIERLTDSAQLIDIAKNSKGRKDRDVLLAVMDNPHFSDQNILCNIAKNDKISWLRGEAVEKITDQKLLTHIAKNDRDSWVRGVAEDRLKELKRK